MLAQNVVGLNGGGSISRIPAFCPFAVRAEVCRRASTWNSPETDWERNCPELAPFQKSVGLNASKVSHPGRGAPTVYDAGGLSQRQWGSNEVPPNSSEWSSKEDAFQAMSFQETGFPSPMSFDVYVAVAGG